MALGAIEELKAHGLSVPKDLPVCGFDGADHRALREAVAVHQSASPSSCIGARAVDMIVRMIEGEPVPEYNLFPVELTLRESCGCGYQVEPAGAPPSTGVERAAPVRWPAGRWLERLLEKGVAIPGRDRSTAGPALLLSALEEELEGDRGALPARGRVAPRRGGARGGDPRALPGQ